jgi:cullin 4
VLEEWTIWKKQWHLIRSIFFYMDPTPVFTDMSITIFQTGVLNEDSRIINALLDGILDVVRSHRHGKGAHPQLCIDGVKMTVELGMYTKSLEPALFKESQSYFQTWAKHAVERATLSEYVNMVWATFEAEMSRCDLFQLSSSTRQELELILETVTIRAQKDRLTRADDVQRLLDADAEDDIKRLYKLLGRCSLGQSLIEPFQQWVRKTGESIVYDNDKEDIMVIRLITLRKQSDRIWNGCFVRDGDFGIPMRNAFEHVMNMNKKSAATHNTDNTKQGEMIAKFVDRILRGETMTIPNTLHLAVAEDKDEADVDNELEEDQDSSVDEQLDQVLDIFRFLQGKAVFEEFYKQDLAKRLLMGRSASADAELGMLSRLKTECGESFTQNLETMFKDIDLSREEMAEHKEREKEAEASAPALDLYVNVLSSSAWPSYSDVKVTIPAQVGLALHTFEESYKAQHSGRSLYWKHSLAHCQLKADFGKERKELVVSGFQAIVLLLFNDIGDNDILTYQEIAGGTGLGKHPFTFIHLLI